jgi:hypothetical protein
MQMKFTGSGVATPALLQGQAATTSPEQARL